MARIAAAELHPSFAGAQIELVVEDGDVVEPDLEEPRRLADRAPRFVHEGLRLEEEHALSPRSSPSAAIALETRGARARRGVRARSRRPP